MMSKWIGLNENICLNLDRVLGFSKMYHNDVAIDDEKGTTVTFRYGISFHLGENNPIKEIFDSLEERDAKFEQIKALLGITDDQ